MVKNVSFSIAKIVGLKKVSFSTFRMCRCQKLQFQLGAKNVIFFIVWQIRFIQNSENGLLNVIKVN
jgi:hypothetical protein